MTSEQIVQRLPSLLAEVLGVTPATLRSRRRLNREETTLLRSARRWNADSNLLGFGIGPKRVEGRPNHQRPSLIVFVATKLGTGKLPRTRRIPRSIRFGKGLASIPTDVIEVGGIGVFQAGPLHAGANAAHFSMRAGTITAIVRSTDSAALQLLSCAHVFAPLGATGPEVESPPDPSAISKTNHVANLTRALPLVPGTGSPNRVDAALALPIPGATVTAGVPGLGNVVAVSGLESGAFATNGIRRLVGFGSSTGRVQADLLAESVSTLMRDDRGRVFRFDDVVAYRPTPATAAGDSGMPLFRGVPGGLELVGMHIGASVIRNTSVRAAFMVPISRVFARLSVRLG